MKRKINWKKLKGECDSIFENTLKEGVLESAKYHPPCIRYTVPSEDHKYNPDFLIERILLPNTLIEVKGRFRDMNEANKYIHIRGSVGLTYELVFLFMDPLLPMPNAKKRKDGSIRTHKDFAEKNGFRWFTKDTIEEIL